MALKTLQELVASTKSAVHCLTPDAAREQLAHSANALVIDVREPGEVAQKRPAGTINIPRGVLEMKITEHTTNPDQPILLHCATGGRAALAAAALGQMGFTNVSVIDCSCDDLIAAFGEG